MNIKQFQQLSMDGKLKTLIEHAELIGQRKEDEVNLFIYQLENFYVETKYQSKNDELISIDSFAQLDREDRIKWKILRVIPLYHRKYQN